MQALESFTVCTVLDCSIIQFGVLAGQIPQPVPYEMAALRSRMEAAAQAEHAALKVAAQRDEERLAAAMRAERAEASASAAHNELLDITKRCGRHDARRLKSLSRLTAGFGRLLT